MTPLALEPSTAFIRLDASSTLRTYRDVDRFSTIRVETAGCLADAVHKSSNVAAFLMSISLRPIGSRALNIARIEAGFVLPNFDFVSAEQTLRVGTERSPLELGLSWLVDFKTPDILVDFQGGRIYTKPLNKPVITEDVETELLIVSPDGKLTVKKSHDDDKDSNRRQIAIEGPGILALNSSPMHSLG